MNKRRYWIHPSSWSRYRYGASWQQITLEIKKAIWFLLICFVVWSWIRIPASLWIKIPSFYTHFIDCIQAIFVAKREEGMGICLQDRMPPVLHVLFKEWLLLMPWIVLFYTSVRRYTVQSLTKEHLLAGRSIVSQQKLDRILRKAGDYSNIAIDGYYGFTQHFEVQHLLISGTTGTGKSVFLAKLLDEIRQRGDRAIIYDKGCGFIESFYHEKTDCILNPFDQRSLSWDIWCDASSMAEFEHLAAALIPLAAQEDPFWVQSARVIFSCVAFKMSKMKHPTIESLLYQLLHAPLHTLSDYLQESDAAFLMSEKIEKTAVSIRSVLAVHVKALRYLGHTHACASPLFSIKDWLLKEEAYPGGFLFLSSRGQEHTALRPLISMWLSIASNALLSMVPNPKRRIWILMDELSSLYRLPDLAPTMAEVRKFGGCFVLGVQSFAQLSESYGHKAGQVIMDLCSTKIFFRTSSYEMAESVSAEIGEQEVQQETENIHFKTLQQYTISFASRQIKQAAVSPYDLLTLRDLYYYLRPVGPYPVALCRLLWKKRVHQAVSFIPRSHDQVNHLQHDQACAAKEDERCFLDPVMHQKRPTQPYRFKERCRSEQADG